MPGRATLYTSPPRFRTRLGQTLASPLSVLVLVPALVVGVGVFMAVSGQRSLRASIDTMAEARFADQTAYASRHIRETLGQAGPLLDRFRVFLRERGGEVTTEELAYQLVTLMHDRGGLSFASYGRKDGHFVGVYVDDWGNFWVTDRRVGPEGKTLLRDYRMPSVGPPILMREDPDFGYDVRTRPFYQQVIEAGHRIWTEPYVFFDSGVPEITCAEPYLDADGEFIGALSVDFNLNDLSEFVGSLETVPTGRVFVFTADRALLALPGVRQEFGRDARGAGELLRVEDLDDPVLHAFFDQHPPLDVPDGVREPFTFAAGEEAFLAAVSPCVVDDQVTWYVGALASRSFFMAPADDHLLGALRIAGVALAVALGVASLFAVNLVRSRREVALARAAARAAKKEVRELGSYRLIRRIGEGGMGEVWLGEHRMLARPAAIKLIHGEALAELPQAKVAEILASFEKEARVTANLSSVNTVRLYDFGVSREGVFFYVMELLDGLDLQALVDSWGPQPIGRVVLILRQVCSSLAEAHDRQLVHLDIKPANIFLCRQGDEGDVVKVLDFGLVKIRTERLAAGQQDRDEMIAGTPAYMAPERGMGKPDVDARADIYSVGCLAFWLLAGRCVFDTESPTVMLRHHVEQDPVPPSTLAPTALPPELDALVLSCLAKDPAKRPASARALRRLLDQVPVPEDQAWDEPTIRTWWEESGDRVEEIARALLTGEGRRLERGTTEVMLETVTEDAVDAIRTVRKIDTVQ